MPLYEFQCDQLHMWEINVPMVDRDEPQVCEECGDFGRRLLSPSVIQFNAKDFYSTENPKK